MVEKVRCQTQAAQTEAAWSRCVASHRAGRGRTVAAGRSAATTTSSAPAWRLAQAGRFLPQAADVVRWLRSCQAWFLAGPRFLAGQGLPRQGSHSVAWPARRPLSFLVLPSPDQHAAKPDCHGQGVSDDDGPSQPCCRAARTSPWHRPGPSCRRRQRVGPPRPHPHLRYPPPRGAAAFPAPRAW